MASSLIPAEVSLAAAAVLAATGLTLTYAALSPGSRLFGPTLIAGNDPTEVALTYDDGPNDAATLPLLEILARHNARATFFMIGSFVRLRPEIVRRVHAAGHLIGNHTQTHPWLSFQSSRVIREVCGYDASVSCRFTHIYPDGPAPYFSYSAPGTVNGDLRSSLAKWREIKQAANEFVVGLGGTVTHHHAVGRDHRNGYEGQSSPLFRGALAAAKQSLDPAGILNPGVLIDPIDRAVGIRGALG